MTTKAKVFKAFAQGLTAQEAIKKLKSVPKGTVSAYYTKFKGETTPVKKVKDKTKKLSVKSTKSLIEDLSRGNVAFPSFSVEIPSSDSLNQAWAEPQKSNMSLNIKRSVISLICDTDLIPKDKKADFIITAMDVL